MTRARTLTTVAALLVLATTAQAGVWQRAIDKGAAEEANNFYEIAMRNGDEQVEAAMQRSAALGVVVDDIKRAIAQYRIAAKARPDAAEPYFRIGHLLNQMYFAPCGMDSPITCATGGSAARAREAVQAWDEFEIRAPLDPRLQELLVNRAILRTKLVTGNSKDDRAYLEGALRDYQAALDHADGLTQAINTSNETVWGNIAETYMMLDRLDDAVLAYEQALREGGGISCVYGLAVALDRDERTTHALEVIRAQGLENKKKFEQLFLAQQVFFVPRGEEQYYFALVEEAFGNVDESLEHWQAYLASGAHPEFQPRATFHIASLRGHRPQPVKLPEALPRVFDPPLPMNPPPQRAQRPKP